MAFWQQLRWQIGILYPKPLLLFPIFLVFGDRSFTTLPKRFGQVNILELVMRGSDRFLIGHARLFVLGLEVRHELFVRLSRCDFPFLLLTSAHKQSFAVLGQVLAWVPVINALDDGSTPGNGGAHALSFAQLQKHLVKALAFLIGNKTGGAICTWQQRNAIAFQFSAVRSARRFGFSNGLRSLSNALA